MLRRSFEEHLEPSKNESEREDKLAKTYRALIVARRAWLKTKEGQKPPSNDSLVVAIQFPGRACRQEPLGLGSFTFELFPQASNLAF